MKQIYRIPGLVGDKTGRPSGNFHTPSKPTVQRLALVLCGNLPPHPIPSEGLIHNNRSDPVKTNFCLF